MSDALAEVSQLSQFTQLRLLGFSVRDAAALVRGGEAARVIEERTDARRGN